MNNIQKRFFLFLIGCMGTRIGFAYLAKEIDKEYLPYMGYLGLIPAIGFMYIFLTGSREKGGEVFGAKIWWNSLRPIHAILWSLFSLCAIRKKREGKSKTYNLVSMKNNRQIIFKVISNFIFWG